MSPDRGQIDPRGISAVVAVIAFLVLVVALTMIDAGRATLTGLVGTASIGSPVAIVAAFAIAIVGAIVGYFLARVSVGLA